MGGHCIATSLADKRAGCVQKWQGKQPIQFENHTHHLGVPWPKDSGNMNEYSLQLLGQANLLQDSSEVFNCNHCIKILMAIQLISLNI